MITPNTIFQPLDLQDDDINISLNSNSIPIENRLAKSGRCIVCYCLKGWANMEVNLVKHLFAESEILVLFPNQIVEQTDVSDNFSVMYFSISPNVLQEVCFRFPPDFLVFLRKNFYYKVSADLLQGEQVRFAMIQQKIQDIENFCRREIVMNLLRIYFLELYNKLRRSKLGKSTSNNNRKSELYEEFSNLVMDNYQTNRDVHFYAEKLNISSKYLSMITSEITGFGAKQWIDDYVILELKIRIKASQENIQKIADDLNFADQAFLCKYFKMRTGISPSEYRKA